MDEQQQDAEAGHEQPHAEHGRPRREPAGPPAPDPMPPGPPPRTAAGIEAARQAAAQAAHATRSAAGFPSPPPAEPAALRMHVSRRGLLTGLGAVLVATAVPASVVLLNDGEGDGAQGATQGHAGAATSRGPQPGRSGPGRTPRAVPTLPPVALPAHPTLRPLATLRHDGEVGAFRFGPDGRTLAVAESGKGVRLWDVDHRTSRSTPPAGSREVTALAFSPDGRTLATGSEERARFWDTATLRPRGKEIARTDDDAFTTFSAVAFSPDGEVFVATGFSNDEIRVYDPVTRRPDGKALAPGEAAIMVFGPDGRTLVTVDESGSDGVRIWDMTTRTSRSEPSLDVFGGAANLVISPDGRTVAVDSDSERVRFIDVATGKERGAPLGGHIGSVTGLAYSTDGRTVLTCDYAGLHLWDAATRKKRGTVTIPGTPPKVEKHGHVVVTTPGTRTIRAFAFSPDGRTVATAGFQARTIALWRLE